MWVEERYQRIRDLMQTLGHVTVERITADLDVSRETVRRDLLELERLGEIRRVHGGAVLADSEPPIDVRATTRVAEKRALAKAVAAMVESGQTLFIDAGSTTSILADALSTRAGLHVVTNSVAVVERLAPVRPEAANSGNASHLLGGSFDASVRATYGSSTIAEIHRFRADVALLSPVAVDAQRGCQSFFAEEAELARAMCSNARRVIILADYSKLGSHSRISYCLPDQVDVLVTNRKAMRSPGADALAKAFRRIDYV